jgi:hypothetical protein
MKINVLDSINDIMSLFDYLDVDSMSESDINMTSFMSEEEQSSV